MTLSKEQFLIDSLKHCGIPYIWGGEDQNGCDCSGYLEIVLSQWGLNPDGRQTAQRFFDYFSKQGRGVLVADSEISAGNLLFFGKDLKSITHVGMALNSGLMVEAGGGGRAIDTVEKAWKARAKVRVSSITRRPDLVARVKITGLNIL